MKNISVARYLGDFSAINMTQRRLGGNGHSYYFPMLSEQNTNEWSEILCTNHLVKHKLISFRVKSGQSPRKNIPAQVIVTLDAPNRTLTSSPSVTTLFLNAIT